MASGSDARSTYAQILRSSALIGGSSVLTLAIGIVRNKGLALLLGPTGFGLFAMYGSIVDVAQSIAGMGVRSSGVRQIAQSASASDEAAIARTTTVLRRTSVLLALAGALLLIACAPLVSKITFGSIDHAQGVALLSIAVSIGVVAGAQQALLQGMRRIAELAKLGVYGAMIGTALTLAIVHVFGEKGVVPSLIAVAVASLASTWWYSRNVRIPRARMSRVAMRQEARSLLHLGFAFMLSAFLMMAAAYAVRIIVLNDAGLEAAGFYQAAWSIGGLYIGFILQAMAADFYPRLVSVSTDNPECNRLVNEQATVSFLLAGPGVLATLTFSAPIVTLFFSPEFAPTAGVLRWICLGMTLRVFTWPMGFIIVAKGRRTMFLLTEAAWTVVSVGLAWGCVQVVGLDGAGIAFFGSYVFHFVMIYPLVRKLSGFFWSATNVKAGLILLASIAVVFLALQALPVEWAIAAGVLAIVASSIYSIRMLVALAPRDCLPERLWRLLELIPVASAHRK